MTDLNAVEVSFTQAKQQQLIISRMCVCVRVTKVPLCTGRSLVSKTLSAPHIETPGPRCDMSSNAPNSCLSVVKLSHCFFFLLDVFLSLLK